MRSKYNTLRHAFALVTLSAGLASAAVNAPSESFTFNFNSKPACPSPAWFDGVEWDGGDIKGNPQCWTVDRTAPDHAGRILIHLKTTELPADLSLTLVYEDLDDSEFLIQLLDEDENILVPDMFSGIVATSRDTKSDTYIINFMHHAKARKIAIQRLRGPLKIYGFDLMSVVCELPSVVDTDRENCLAHNVNADRNVHARVQKAVDALAGQKLDWDQRLLLLSQQEEPESIARTLIAASKLPEYVPEAEVSGTGTVRVTATCLAAISDAVKALQRWHPGLHIELKSGDTSQVEQMLLEGQTRIAVGGDPMDLEDRERYFKKWNKAPVDFPVATDTIRILVNEKNPATHITLSELERIYAADASLSGGSITAWGQLGHSTGWAGPMTVYGGDPAWGTSRAFSKLAMQGKPFNGRIIEDSVMHHDGVEQQVALNPGGIGFVARTPRTLAAKVLPVAISSGREAYLPNVANIYNGNYPLTRRFIMTIGADDVSGLTPAERELIDFILSKQGQAELTRSGLLPLTLEQLIHARNRLKLDE